MLFSRGKMKNDNYRFKLGQFNCWVVNDGSLTVPPPPTEKSGVPAEEMNVLSLVIDSGEQIILIDTGCGDRFRGTDTGKLVTNLKAAGIGCSDIDVVIFTHGHIDHAAGTVNRSGNPIFPRARYIVAQKEWQCWVDKNERKELQPMFNAARHDLLPIPRQFHLAAEGEEILPGIVLTTAPGHTPGSSILHISSGGKKLSCIGDLIHSAIEFSRPDYYSFLDSDSSQAIRSRTRVLSDLATTGELTFACHFPFPGLGFVVEKGDLYSWKPL